ncbi:tRNA pseudouridine(38/39) synthase [Trichomonascus vanleenenianus]|uniref:pseudouridine synthase DEG1 n=1 Tax=Trichomonascus vanleenenianus TaxID=2268995 RepID=UPI003ECA1E9F
MATNTDHTKWTKEQLLSRIKELENLSSKNDLINRVKELEARAPPKRELPPHSNPSTPEKQPTKKKKEMDFSKFATRKIAIRFAYVGWNYHGLAVQTSSDPEEVPTVEHQILAVLHRTRLIPTMDVSDCEFSRCGRTDRGVSALRQVISLRVRSVLSKEDQQDPSKDSKELDYLHILNNLLPADIRAYEICLRPGDEFDARFSCISRHYKYLFLTEGLDIEAMNKAAGYFLGEHDFRNFCKVDPSKQISNFKRTVMAASIVPHESIPSMVYFDLKGTAFLWHQVRSMIAVLFMVGQKLEAPEMVRDLLDMSKYPRRPVYEMAADFPLVLYDCEFPPDMEWKSFRNGETQERTYVKLHDLWYDQWVKTAMVGEMKKMFEQCAHSEIPVKENPNKIFINTGAGMGRATTKYAKLEKRERLEEPDIVNKRWLEKKNAKNASA